MMIQRGLETDHSGFSLLELVFTMSDELQPWLLKVNDMASKDCSILEKGEDLFDESKSTFLKDSFKVIGNDLLLRQ